MDGPYVFTTPGYTDLYAQTASGIAVAVAHASGYTTGWYVALASAWKAAGLTTGRHPGVIYHGNYAAPLPATDEPEAVFEIYFDGESVVAVNDVTLLDGSREAAQKSKAERVTE